MSFDTGGDGIMTNQFQLRKDIVEIGRRVYQRGYVAANDGNISVRVDENRILITPTGVSKGFMTPEEIVLCDMAGKPLTRGPGPSSEIFMHLKVYEMRPEIHAIVHAHPVYATAFGVAGIPLTQALLPEVIITLGGIPLAEYGTPGTEELYRPLIKYLDTYDAFLLQNHGALAIGKDLLSAYFRMETLEHCAQITLVSKQLGNIHTLSPDDVEKLLVQRKTAGLPGEFTAHSCSGVGASDACAILEPADTVITAQESSPMESPGIPNESLKKIIGKVIEELGLDFQGKTG